MVGHRATRTPPCCPLRQGPDRPSERLRHCGGKGHPVHIAPRRSSGHPQAAQMASTAPAHLGLHGAPDQQARRAVKIGAGSLTLEWLLRLKCASVGHYEVEGSSQGRGGRDHPASKLWPLDRRPRGTDRVQGVVGKHGGSAKAHDKAWADDSRLHAVIIPDRTQGARNGTVYPQVLLFAADRATVMGNPMGTLMLHC